MHNCLVGNPIIIPRAGDPSSLGPPTTGRAWRCLFRPWPPLGWAAAAPSWMCSMSLSSGWILPVSGWI
jgi:hypothetical protein